MRRLLAALFLLLAFSGPSSAENNYAPTTFSNIGSTTAAFTLKAGLYGVEAVATWGGGTVTLSRLAGDGTTYVSTGVSFTANGYTTVQIPSGTYEVVIATASAVYVQIAPIALLP